MIVLRRKVIVWVSAIVVTLALVVLPGCKKSEPVKKTAPSSSKKLPKNME